MTKRLSCLVIFVCLTAPAADWITAATPLTLANWPTSWQGAKVGVGDSSISVTALQRFCFAGNSGQHTIILLKLSDFSLVATTVVNMAGCLPGTFVAAPVTATMNANEGYLLMGSEMASSDTFSSTSSIAFRNSVAYSMLAAYSSIIPPALPTAAAYALDDSRAMAGLYSFQFLTGSPAIGSLSPNTAFTNERTSIVVHGAGSNWTQGASAISFSGVGVNVISLTVISAETAVAVIAVDSGAETTSRDVTITTGNEVVTFKNGITLMPPVAQGNTCSSIPLGPNLTSGGSLGGFIPFPHSRGWYANITNFPVDKKSTTYMNDILPPLSTKHLRSLYPPSWLDANGWGTWDGLFYNIVDHTQPRVNADYISVSEPADSDPGPYPIPMPPLVSGTIGPAGTINYGVPGDKQAIVIDRDACILYEFDQMDYSTSGHPIINRAAVFDLLGGDHQRPYDFTSNGVSGLPRLPGIVRGEELDGEITHAIGITAYRGFLDKSYVDMASHAQYGGPWVPSMVPFGAKLRLRADFDVTPFPKQAQQILRALKTYGGILMDGGNVIDIYGAVDNRWDQPSTLSLYFDYHLDASDFDVIQTGTVFCDPSLYCGNFGPKGTVPVINSFTASRANVGPLQPVTLTADVIGVPSRLRFITPDVGAVVSDTVTVTPSVTTTYTLMVQNETGRSTKTVTVYVTQASQVITFTAPGPVSLGAPLALTATSSSGLAVSFVSTTAGVCTVSGSTLTPLTAGTCSIAASQAGNANYAAAAPVLQSFTIGMASQTITFGPLSGVTFGAAAFTVTATSSSGLAVSFTSATPLVCAVSGSTVTPVAVGTCSIAAGQNGNASYGAAAPVVQSFAITQASQVITFAAPGPVSLGAPLALTATSSSGLAVSFVSTTAGVCTVSGSTLTPLTAGTCSIAASQAGNANYAAAAPAVQSFTIGMASQTITFGPLSGVTFGAAAFTVTATSSSGLAVSFTSATPLVCAVSGSTVTPVAVGTCSIAAGQNGNASYGAAAPVLQSFAITQASQVITFAAPGPASLGAPLALTATSSSGLAVSFVSTTAGVCTVSGSTLTPLTAGTCSIAASQAGNANYAAAAPVVQSFTIGMASQTITFGPLSGVTFGAAAFTVTATSSSGLAVSFTSATPLVCAVSGSTVTPVAVGTCSIAAGQNGNASYGAAAPVVQSFVITQASQVITFAAPGPVSLGAPLALTATSSSGLAVSFVSTTAGVCTVSGSTLTPLTAGTCSIAASQAGNANYAAAAPAVQSFTIGMASQTITFGPLSGVTFGAAAFTVTATSSSGLAVSFTSATPLVCAVSGSTVTPVAVGTCSIAAGQNGNASYGAAAPVLQSFAITQASQVITFAAPGPVSLGAPLALTATSSSGLAVSFTSATPLVCAVSGSTVTPVAVGTCSIAAGQNGNASYGAAAPVVQSFAITQASQVITFAAPGPVSLGAPLALTATSSSGLAVSFVSNDRRGLHR